MTGLWGKTWNANNVRGFVDGLVERVQQRALVVLDPLRGLHLNEVVHAGCGCVAWSPLSNDSHYMREIDK
jgi:hypothetical protein